jgi:hypothetical protein
MHFYRENVGPPSLRTRVILLGYAASVSVAMALVFYSLAISTALPVVGNALELSSYLVYAGLIAAAWSLFVGWRRSARQAQQRYAILLLGVALILLSQILQTTTNFLLTGPGTPAGFWVDIGNLLAGVFAPALLAYAVLRHRVFDLSFAVNRTLIFSIVSAILLLTFGLAEWIVNDQLGIQALRDNPLVAAAIALGLFLMFNRVHRVVEGAVETLFFRSWRENEAALRRFMREASFVQKGDVLARDFAAALRRFTSGAEIAIYLRGESSGYDLAEGVLAGVAASIDADEPTLVAMRADKAAVDVDASRSSLKATLALPMINRHEIEGFVLLGAKPSGLAYRPDEKEALAQAVEKVGLDLHALKVEELERRVANLETRNDELRGALSSAIATKPA